MLKIYRRKFVFLFVLLAVQISFVFAQGAIKLNVDATEAARNVLRVRETMPVTKAGDFALYYPKWIPGEHAPTGTLNDVVNLYITAKGKPLEWRRDDVDMFEFHLTIPNGTKEIEIAFDDVSPPGTIASAELSRIKWNRLVFYPEGAKADNVQVTASMKLPADWKYATALQTADETQNSVSFKPVTLTMLVDSPAVIGRFYKKIPLIDEGGATHQIDAFADSAEALEYKPETLQGWKNLVRQANLTFGAHHYNYYKFLLTLSDVGGSEGLEHHQSSEDGVGEKSFTEPFRLLDLGDLLGHEYAHSWNGKYRRPAGLATGDYETPQKAELLWVYEGLTQYLGHVLPTRAGLWTPEVFREVVAADAADLNNQTGRRWRPLVDTARAVQFTYGSPRAWRNERRRVDYYDEGALIWMDADVLIRQKSNGKLSLNDFLRKFHGGRNTPPEIVPYSFEDVVRTLNEVLPYDWSGFLKERVYTIQRNAPLGGIMNGGWRLVYNDTPNVYINGAETTYNYLNAFFSIGAMFRADGTVSDINPDMAAAKAGLAPGMKVTKINGTDFSLENLHKAIAATKNNAPLEFTAENGNSTQTYKINYTGGERYPHLERVTGKQDILSEITKPLNSQGFVLTFFPSSRRAEVINQPANVTNVALSRTEITANCSNNSIVCSDGSGNILISTDAVDHENDVLAYSYTVAAGKIIGQGSKVVWDLSGVKPGTYTITAAVDDGCGFCGKPIIKEVKVVKCQNCN